jgi:hypothetical protein
MHLRRLVNEELHAESADCCGGCLTTATAAARHGTVLVRIVTRHSIKGMSQNCHDGNFSTRRNGDPSAHSGSRVRAKSKLMVCCFMVKPYMPPWRHPVTATTTTTSSNSIHIIRILVEFGW